MSKTCNGCSTENMPISIPYVAHEKEATRLMKIIKSLVAIILVLILLLVGSNIGWLIYENSFEDITEEIVVDAGENGNANYIGNDGDIYNGKDNS